MPVQLECGKQHGPKRFKILFCLQLYGDLVDIRFNANKDMA